MKVGVPNQFGSEMCFANLLYVCNYLPPVKSFSQGTCDPGQVALFPADSTQLFGFESKLDKHAKYGNQTGTVTTSDGTLTMNLVILVTLK